MKFSRPNPQGRWLNGCIPPNILAKIRLYTLLTLAGFLSNAHAATIPFKIHSTKTLQTVTGKVTDAQGEALPGVNVVLKGTQQGTSTDIQGKFTLDIQKTGSVLVFSFIGYLTQEVIAKADGPMEVTLQSDEKSLDELVVVGYGSQKKSSVTGSVSVINSKTLENRPTTNALSALQGAAPGLVITRSSGQPGKENWVAQIRNFTSVNGSSPLILVDGVEQANIGTLNQNDIESVSVLKDASVAAIYGARAAGGVILITTKKGHSGRLTVSYSGLYSVNRAFNMPKRLHSWQEATMQNEAAVNAGLTPPFKDEEIELLKNPAINYIVDPANTSAYKYYDDSNGIDSVARKSTSQQQHTISINGGNDNTQYLISLGYFTQNGLFKFGPDDYNRYNLRFNLNTQLTKWLSLDSRIGYTNQQVLSPMASVGGDYGLLYNVYSLRSFAPIHLPGSSDKYNDYSSSNQTYAYLKDGGKTNERTDNFNGVFTLQSSGVIKGLNLKAIYAPYFQGYNYKRSIRTIPRYNRTGISSYFNNPNSYSVQNANTTRENYQFLADYGHQIGKSHSFRLLAGYQFEKYRFSTNVATAKNLTSNDLFSLNLGDPTLYSASDTVSTWAMQSVFGRLSYNFADKYFVEGVVRYDGSSKLAPGYRYNAFPSVSAAWRLGQEQWFNKLLPVFSEFKLRASIGKLGNSDLSSFGNYDYIASLTKSAAYPINNVPNYGYYNDALASPKKTWEQITTKNIGVDIALLRNRLTLSGDYYIKKNTNMLVKVNTTAMIGINTGQYNDASMKAWGWEISAGWRDKIGEHFNYWFNGNISDSKNKVLSYQGTSVYTDGLNKVITGEEINTIWGYQALGLYGSKQEIDARGVFQSNLTGPGDIIYKDVDNSGRIDAGTNSKDNHGDLVKLGSTTPRYTYGFNAGFNVKGFDFSVLFQGVGQRSMLINSYFMLPFRESWRQPVQGQDDYWTPDHKDAKFPRLYLGGGQNVSTSSWWVQKASYIRLKNLQVGYTLPAALTQKARMSAVRFYLSGQDLWEKSRMWLNYYDPEEPNNTSFNYPFFRSYAMGVNITF